MTALFAEEAIDARQLAEGSRRLHSTLAGIETRMNAAVMPTVLDGLLGAGDVSAMWGALSLDRCRAVVDTLVTVTILPGKRGRKAGGTYFDPNSVKIVWKDQA